MYQRKLLAVVSVDESKRVRCQHPGCKQSIYRSIHVINDAGSIKVIGSTCIQKGAYGDLGDAAFTATGGGGRLLTDEERDELLNNTDELVRRLEAQYLSRIRLEEQAKELAEIAQLEARQAKLSTLNQRMVGNARSNSVLYSPRPSGQHLNSGSSQRGLSIPWPWADPMRSVLYMELEDGTQWLRVQARATSGGRHHLVPFPTFEGWDEVLPSKYGFPNAFGNGYEITDLIPALNYMRSLRARREVICASFHHVFGVARLKHDAP
ncbi:hypothetical protein P245_19680 [Comamonas thiooxydans]|uniref:Uncharacterized protein n=1 Tax=Comamonas thiooxydans TaxID=363952 RepID=A0A0E3BGL1_9BURK|nr:hypothetical protein [Comamonas thiooxydans]KGG87674.1 hypothetical protein P245_19680 [Comamonas thiooxydans]